MPKNDYVCDCPTVHEETVNEVRGKMLPMAEFCRVADFFSVFGTETRVRILFALDCREMCVCDLANLLGMTKSAVSHQLATLRDAGLVRFRRDGKSVFYALADDHVKVILDTGILHVKEQEES